MKFPYGAFHASVVLLSTAMAASAAAQSAPSPNDTAPSRVVAAPAATSYPTDAAGDGATGGGYNPSRWAEDWRRYRDPAKRDDPLDRLKYLPLDGDGDAYLTLSGEFRTRVNLTTNPGLRKLPAQRQDIYRVFVGADLHLDDHFRVFGELARGAISGPNIGVPAATLRNDLFLQQLFVEIRGDVGDVGVGARYGRQEFVDGANLLTANRDNNTLRFTLNGLRAWARGTRVRADAFDFQLTRYGEGSIGDDIWDPTRRFSGVTTGIVLPKTLLGGSRLYLDPFVWRLRNRAALWGSTTAREERVYTGGRLWGEAGPVTLDWTVNHQGGEFDARALDAWQLFFAQTYRLGKTAAAPRIGFHADYATGGGGYGQGTLRNATAPFGNNIYYSYGLFLTPTNLIAIAPNVTMSPTKAIRVTPEFQWTWRQTTGDAIYRANGTAYAGTQLTTSKRTAQVARVQIVWTIAPRISFTGRLEHLFAGPGLTQAGYRDSSFAGGWFSFRL